MLTGAQLVVQALEEQGVEVAFGRPGVHNLALWRAVGESGIRLVGVRHEQTAAYAADGYARASGRLGVALTTTGPGAANTLAAVGEAWASRQPLLVIATDVPTTVRRPGVWRASLHEATDQAAMFEPVTKGTLRVRSAASLGAIGTDFDGPMTLNWTMPQPPHLIAINVDAEDAAKAYLPDLTLEADAREATELLAHRVEQRGGLQALGRRLQELHLDVRRGLEESDPEAVEFLDAFAGALPDDAAVGCDMCIPGYWLRGLPRPPPPPNARPPL